MKNKNIQEEHKSNFLAKIILGVLAIFVVNTVFFFLSPDAQSANFVYNATEKIPGFEEKGMSDFPTMIESLYKFSIWVVGICALFMITIGGFTYMTAAGNTSTAGTGKKMITDAIIGLILVLTAALLFSVINPNITKVKLQITPVSTGDSKK